MSHSKDAYVRADSRAQFAARNSFGVGNIPSVAEWFRRAFAAWFRRRSMMRIAALDDRMLADIGLSRADIDRAMLAPSSFESVTELERRRGRRIAANERRARAIAAHRAQVETDAIARQ